MVNYNPKEWFTFIFRFHKGDTFRKLLPIIIAISLYAGFVAWLEIEYLEIDEENKLKNLTILHSLLTFVISAMLVFRINSAYDRWYEGRKLWGSLLNSSRNLALKLHAVLGNEKENVDRIFFKSMISNYAIMLKNHILLNVLPDELIDHPLLEKASLSNDKHLPNHIARLIVSYLFMLKRKAQISENDLLLMNHEMTNFTEVCGACERIKNTPIPFSYNTFLKKFIFFFVMTLPLTLCFSLGYFAIPVTAFIFYVLASMELIAEEIEDPFGKDSNDLPTDAIAKNIRKSVEEILG